MHVIVDIVTISFMLLIPIWLLLLVMGAFFTGGHRHSPGAGHLKQRLARGRNPFK